MSNFQLKTSAAQKGFTLIEMSIVLVIIGLIIGGILKGQEIIDASRQKNFVSQIDSYRSAMNTFQDRYAALPGDYGLATTRLNAGAVNGNGNGIVGGEATNLATILSYTGAQAAGAAGATVAADANENMNFFCQLSSANLMGGGSTQCAAAATFFGNGSPLPAVSYPNAGVTVVTGTFEIANSRNALWARIHRDADAAIAAGTSGALSGRVMSQLDLKYDDGTPVGGVMRSAGIGAACPAANSTSAYSALNEDPDCVMLVELVQ